MAPAPDFLHPSMIAPCGMNCGLCIGHLRAKRPCSGCNGDDAPKANHCSVCRIRNCPELQPPGRTFCCECPGIPCARLRQLDKRYRTNHGVSMLENLESIRRLGLEAFLEGEKPRWTCPGCGGVICVHRDRCLTCGHPRSCLPTKGFESRPFPNIMEEPPH